MRPHDAVHARADRLQELGRARHRAVGVREVVLLERRQGDHLGRGAAAPRRRAGDDVLRLAVVAAKTQAIGCRFRRCARDPERQARPPREVARAGRAVRGDVADEELGERIGRGRGIRHPLLGEHEVLLARRAARARHDRALADHAAQRERVEHVVAPLPGGETPPPSSTANSSLRASRLPPRERARATPLGARRSRRRRCPRRGARAAACLRWRSPVTESTQARSRAGMTWIVPRIVHERTISPRSNAASTSRTLGLADRARGERPAAAPELLRLRGEHVRGRGGDVGAGALSRCDRSRRSSTRAVFTSHSAAPCGQRASAVSRAARAQSHRSRASGQDGEAHGRAGMKPSLEESAMPHHDHEHHREHPHDHDQPQGNDDLASSSSAGSTRP